MTALNPVLARITATDLDPNETSLPRLQRRGLQMVLRTTRLQRRSIAGRATGRYRHPLTDRL